MYDLSVTLHVLAALVGFGLTYSYPVLRLRWRPATSPRATGAPPRRPGAATRPATRREGDRHLFGTVNALLALGAVAALAVVIGYRPVELRAVALAAAIALVLLALLIGGPLRRTR